VYITGSFNKIVNNHFYGIDNHQDVGGHYGAVHIAGERNIVSGNTFDDFLFSAVSIYGSPGPGGKHNTIANNVMTAAPTVGDPNYRESMGVYVLNDADYNIIEGNQISNASNECIVLITSAIGHVEGNIVRNNVLKDCLFAGVSLDSLPSDYRVLFNIVEGNQILATSAVPRGPGEREPDGIRIHAAHRNIIRGNYIDGCSGSDDCNVKHIRVGISNEEKALENLVEGNFVQRTYHTGIQASGDNSKYIGNTVNDCEWGISARYGYNMIISQNHIMNSPDEALLLWEPIHGTAVYGNKTDKLIKLMESDSRVGADIWENQVIKGSGNRYQGEAQLGSGGKVWVETWGYGPGSSDGHVDLWYKTPSAPGALFVAQICRSGCPTYCGTGRPCFQVQSTNSADRSVIGWRIVK
jgi:parallel beta-helix repeat protein